MSEEQAQEATGAEKCEDEKWTASDINWFLTWITFTIAWMLATQDSPGPLRVVSVACTFAAFRGAAPGLRQLDIEKLTTRDALTVAPLLLILVVVISLNQTPPAWLWAIPAAAGCILYGTYRRPVTWRDFASITSICATVYFFIVTQNSDIYWVKWIGALALLGAAQVFLVHPANPKYGGLVSTIYAVPSLLLVAVILYGGGIPNWAWVAIAVGCVGFLFYSLDWSAKTKPMKMEASECGTMDDVQKEE